MHVAQMRLFKKWLVLLCVPPPPPLSLTVCGLSLSLSLSFTVCGPSLPLSLSLSLCLSLWMCSEWPLLSCENRGPSESRQHLLHELCSTVTQVCVPPPPPSLSLSLSLSLHSGMLFSYQRYFCLSLSLLQSYNNNIQPPFFPNSSNSSLLCLNLHLSPSLSFLTYANISLSHELNHSCIFSFTAAI